MGRAQALGAAMANATGVQTAAHAVGIDRPYRGARATFNAWAGKEED